MKEDGDPSLAFSPLCPDSAVVAPRTTGAWVHRLCLQEGLQAFFASSWRDRPWSTRTRQPEDTRGPRRKVSAGLRAAWIPRLPRPRKSSKKRQCFLPEPQKTCGAARRVLKVPDADTGTAAFSPALTSSTSLSPLGPKRKISPVPRVSRQRVGWLRRKRRHTQEERAMDNFNFN